MASYPVVNMALPPELVGPFSFTKTELSQLLGGSTQGLFVRYASTFSFHTTASRRTDWSYAV